MQCFFKDCAAPVEPGTWKCQFHRHRARCLASNCRNQVYARKLCVKHGGKKPCQVPRCQANSRVANLCSRHFAVVAQQKRCPFDQCPHPPEGPGPCIHHGGKLRPQDGNGCAIDGCDGHALEGTAHCPFHTQMKSPQDEQDSMEPTEWMEHPRTMLEDDLVQFLLAIDVGDCV
ncbi:hypothetical protein AeNC1_009122 [Aphanomyces euteiches]|nr:hypothetical protein AeRB84_007038 [Aphanomyces euteiches]KAH9188899.1 hypothetical protein AeNC1_009122 [Aphanomyces euteiches]